MNLITVLFASFMFTFFSPQLKMEENTLKKVNEINFITYQKSWKEEYKDANIFIESTLIVYTDQKTNMNQERFVFRYTNLTDKKLKLSFSRKLYYNGVCYGCDKADKVFTIELQPGEIKEYSDINKDKTFYIFSKDRNGTIKRTLDKYELLNIETIVQ